MDRRETIKLLALAPFAFTWTRLDAELASRKSAAARAAGRFQAQFFTDHEFETVRLLVDMIIPADDRSGSATDVGVPEFMGFIMVDRPPMQTPMRGGLAWLDTYCEERFEQAFTACTDVQQRQVLDAIAYPGDADSELSHGVAFFNSFRDLTASGFWTTKEGMDDLGYIGNEYVQEWTGAPEEEIERLGLSRVPWDTI
ncbi:MAG: gluconate 2-dehydrogenase subunit 3 family protein [Rhodothermales bacterium]